MIVLASTSPRRKEILTKANYKFKIVTKEVEENIDSNKTPLENVLALGMKKAQVVAKDYFNDIVIGCDTIVVLDNEIYGKPVDEQDAYLMLKRLANKTHKVISGVGVIYRGDKYSFAVTSLVTFKDLNDEDIINYIKTGECFGKAGGYAIQGLGSNLVLKYEGDLNNIIGLPLNALKEVLDKIGDENDMEN